MIRYKKYQNQTKSTPLSGKWLARAVADETLDTRALAEHMAKHNTPYSQGAIHGVLKDSGAQAIWSKDSAELSVKVMKTEK